MAAISRHVKITGVVQGVGYRAWTHKTALELNLGGWVKNCEDGSVEAVFEGEGPVIETMQKLLKEGPKFSEVEEVIVLSEKHVPQVTGFRVLRN